jgi:hypothetical protein
LKFPGSEHSLIEKISMNGQTVRMVAIGAAVIILLLFPAGAASIKVIPATVTVQKGETAELFLVLDDAWAGLAGYDLVIRFSDPAVAEIPVITYPSWAVLNNTTLNADRSVRISGMDLSRQVNRGMTAVPLATLKVRGISEGSSSISLESVHMGAEGGAAIYPVLSAGHIIVPGNVTPSGESGADNSSVSYVTQPQTFTTPLVSSLDSPITSVPTPSGQETVQIPLTTKPQMPDQTLTLTVPDGPQGIGVPLWIWGLWGLIVLGALVVVAFVAWQREREEW